MYLKKFKRSKLKMNNLVKKFANYVKHIEKYLNVRMFKKIYKTKIQQNLIL